MTVSFFFVLRWYEYTLVKILIPLNDRELQISLKIWKLRETTQSTLFYVNEELLSDPKVIYKSMSSARSRLTQE